LGFLGTWEQLRGLEKQFSKSIKDAKLEKRGSNLFNGKACVVSKKGVEIMVERIKLNNVEVKGSVREKKLIFVRFAIYVTNFFFPLLLFTYSLVAT
jgi:hypothetical protein